MNIAPNPEKETAAGPSPALQNKITIDAGTRSNDGYTIELIAGSAVIDLLLNDAGFQQSWDTLFASCPWATVFQGRQFVAAWYQAYQQQHLPILVRAVERGQLKGMLPMVLLNEGRITGAGHYDAQYQTWLAAPIEGNTFIKKALAELIKQFPGNPISFRFLPNGTPMTWLKEDQQWSQRSIVQPYTRPLLNFSDPEHTKILSGRKHFKNKLNRLKKLGEVRFETIRDLKTFEKSLNEMALLFDFRQSALFNKSHFKDDPIKKEFLLELARLNLLHTTVLSVNGKIMAAVVAVTGVNGWVYLAGINCHSPVNARFYSPGFMHFILLFKQLNEEGVQYFDLTPGYDTYKEELANQHDEVTELVISSKKKFLIKRRIKKWVHTRLVAAGIRPMTIELALKKFNYLLRRRSALSVVKGMAERLHKKRKQQLYLVQANRLPAAIKVTLHKDNLRDLMQFECGKRADVTRWEFLGNAVYRLERGQHCYTFAENGRLLCCAWLSYPDAASAEKDSDLVRDHTIELQGFYCHEAARDRLPDFLHGMLEATMNKERNSIYFLANDRLFCRAMEEAGFRTV
jgi:CelD/BcsL family acetyltransferase involved in cellulose biosynthesis